MKDKDRYGKVYSGRNQVHSEDTRGYGCLCWKCYRIERRNTASRYIKKSTQEESLGVDFDLVASELKKLMVSKNKDYGPDNILKSPGGPVAALGVRLYDKVARLNHLVGKRNKPNHESLRDTLVDIANYAIIGILVIDEKWGKG